MRFKKSISSLLILIGLALLLASCVPTVKVTSIEVDETSVPLSAVVDEFEITRIFLITYKSDGSKARIQLTTSMVNQTERNKLSIVGEQEIKIKYLGLTCSFNITITPPSDGVIMSRLQADREALIVQTEVEDSFTLPLKGDNGSFISWTSSNQALKIDETTGLVTLTRPAFEEGDIELTLLAKLVYFDVQLTQEFDIVVLALPQSGLESEMDLLASNLVVPTTITTSLNLAFSDNNYDDLIINWTSSHPTIIAINNQAKTVQVIQPLNDTVVSLSFEIKYRGQTFSNYQTRKVTVLGFAINPKAPSVSNLIIVSDVLSWNKVDGASNYKVYVNGALKSTVSNNAIDLTTIVSEAGTYIIGVQTMAFKEHTEDAEIITINYIISLYEGNYYKNANLNLIGDLLKAELRSLLTTTQTKATTYENLKTDLQYTDADLTQSGKIILLYSRISVKSTWDGGTTWNREHVWPQSLGWFKTSGAGSDLHHLRPADQVVNSTRGNLKFGDVSNGKQAKLSVTNGGAYIDCFYAGGYFEPTNEVKGDIARIIFFLFTRYYQSDSYDFNSVAQSFNVLLQWHYLDPVDQNEMIRNNRIAEVQGNRNPFIDYPDLVSRIWQ